MAVAVPANVVTATSAAPGVPSGVVTVICMPESIVKVAAVPAKVTDVAFARFVPVMVTVSPPASRPEVGLMD
jgi:hypothetical protein